MTPFNVINLYLICIVNMDVAIARRIRNHATLICAISSVAVAALIMFLNGPKVHLLLGFGDMAKKNTNLAICILSAQNHFEHREAIRKSWLSDIHEQQHEGQRVTAKFVVGRNFCPVHPENRIDPYGCKRWTPSMPENHNLVEAFRSLNVPKQALERRLSFTEYVYVKVMSHIVLTRLGILEEAIPPNLSSNQSIVVTLYDAITNEELVHATFSSMLRGVEHYGYIYRPVEEILLPKGYECVLEVELRPEGIKPWEAWGLNEPAEQPVNAPDVRVEEGHHGIIFTQATDAIGRVLDPNPGTGGSIIPIPSLIFKLGDVAQLQDHVDSIGVRDEAWQREMTDLISRLEAEELRHGDVLLLDLQDVYRTLPHKVLTCQQWFNEHFTSDFVMKTDDDCFVDIPQVLQHLPPKDNGEFVWWGNFRRGWLVERHGKWREEVYDGATYPGFACGSGYVLSGSLSAWLASNSHHLQPLQGEDVSMGVWLSRLRVRHIEDSRWRCDLSCRNRMLALPELTPELIVQHWNFRRSCGSPCEPC